MSLRKTFRENVKYYRKKKKLSQERLAELSNLSANYIGDIERTDRKVTIDTIEKVAKGLKIDPLVLLQKKRRK